MDWSQVFDWRLALAISIILFCFAVFCASVHIGLYSIILKNTGRFSFAKIFPLVLVYGLLSAFLLFVVIFSFFHAL